MRTGEIVQFPRGGSSGPRKAADIKGYTPGELHEFLERIARRAGHHVRLTSIITKHGQGVRPEVAERIAVHVSHYILSGQLLSP